MVEEQLSHCVSKQTQKNHLFNQEPKQVLILKENGNKNLNPFEQLDNSWTLTHFHEREDVSETTKHFCDIRCSG